MRNAKWVNTDWEGKYITMHLEGNARRASFLPAMAQLLSPVGVSWLRTQDGSAGPSDLVSEYFVSHTDIIKAPQRNLFTARRWSVGSAHLSPWNNLL